MQDAVGREISDFAIDAVSILAWHDVGGSFDEEQALSTITAFIADQTNRGQYAAGKAAEKLIRFLGEEGGLFRIVDGVPSWIHQNIRDFMAARTLCILQDAMPAGVRNGLTRDVIELTEDNWSDANRESFVRFVLCMFPDETISQSAVQALLSQGGDSLPFLARALSDGAPISSTLCEELADRLFESAAENFGTCANIFVLASHDPVLAFMMLSWKGPFYTRARAVLRGDLKPAAVQRTTDFQAEIASYLSRLCDASQLEELGRDPQIEQFLRTQLADQPSTVP
jgi:hypothetical protein